MDSFVNIKVFMKIIPKLLFNFICFLLACCIMIKNEQSRSNVHSIRSMSTVSLPPASVPMFLTPNGILSHRQIDPNAIDITSLKGQFAWEKLPKSDTYLPVIFRGDTKYFCVRMLRKILPEYPEDVIRRSVQYNYRKTIELYGVTLYEIELLNRINSQHSRWTYSQQPFTALDEIVRVKDFLPYFDHLRHGSRFTPTISNITVHTLRQLLPQAQQIAQRLSDQAINVPSIVQRPSTVLQATPVQIQTYLPSTNISSTTRPTLPTAPPVGQTKPAKNPYTLLLPPSTSQIQQPIPSSSTNVIKSLYKVPSNNNNDKTPIASIMTPVPMSSLSGSSPASSVLPSLTYNSPCSSSHVALPPILTVNPKQSNSFVSPSSTTTTASSKPSRLHCGWLQVNKLYTPYISTSATNHHLYKLPVSLLTFYDLLKTPPTETTDSKESLLPFEQMIATAEELDLINELCVKQNIKPFGDDTKLIQLSTFYQYFSANILFVKELSNDGPKASICKEWLSIVQINGGICRLRNITTLHEQTVPFIGNNLLKNFLLSTQCLSAASISKPTAAEVEFLQLILFFSNISINLRNAQLIDIESVQKEYNVDLILLFNDKFPLNVLNYQQQGNRSNVSQGSVLSANQTAPTNTIAESTPPPSPPSPPTNQPQSNNPTQLPLTSTSTSSSPNRYYKTIQFHGHSLTAYVCSGLGSNTQRECVSIKSLCNILYPNSLSLDKLEVKMLRLLRSKNISRFRPQNQQSMGFTRLIDIKDAEKHWNDIEQEMRTFLNDIEANAHPHLSSISTENSNASTVMEKLKTDEQPSSETSDEVQRNDKRPLDEPLDDEDVPVLERINKRVRFAEKENSEQLIETSDTQLNNGTTKADEQTTDQPAKKRKINLTSLKQKKKRLIPSTRTNKQLKASWTRKYNIEDCFVQLNQYDPIYDTGED